MFRTREPQESLWQSEFLVTPRKARLMRRSWAQVFRKEALPLLCPHLVPQRPSQTAIGAPKSACRAPANLPSTRIRARIIAPVTPSLLFHCPHAVHPCPSVDSGLGTGLALRRPCFRA